MAKPYRVAAIGLALFLSSLLLLNSWESSAATASSLPAMQPASTPALAGCWIVAEGEAPSDWSAVVTADYITGIVPDGNVIWATSTGGLLRWERDTGSVTQYLSPAIPLPGNSLYDILLHNGKLYISGYGGLAIFDRQATWTQYTAEEIGLEVEYGAHIAMIDDVLWLAADDGIARLYSDGHWEVTSAGEQGLSGKRIEKIVSRENRIYIVVPSGPTAQADRWVMQLQGEEWETVEEPAVRYFEAPGGVLWKGELDGLFTSLDHGNTWELVLEGDGWIYPRAVDADGQLYVSNDDTILVLQDNAVVEKYRFADVGPEVDFVNIIDWDNRGRMWIATDGRGMTMFDGEQWHNWQEGMAGMREDAIRGLAIGEDKLYAGTHGGAGTGGVNIFDFETERWTNFWPGESELSGGGVDGIAIDAQGRVYFPTSEGILDIYDGETWTHIPMPLPKRMILSTSEGLFDQDGNYWVATRNLGLGLWKYDGHEWTVYDIPPDINALTLDREGRFWLGTSGGLVVRDLDGNWLVYTSEQMPLGNGWIEDIAIDQAGRVWIIGYTNLVVFNGQEYQAFKPSVVGASGWGDAVSLDPQGNLWVEAGNGIARFEGKPDIGGFTALTLPPEATIPEQKLKATKTPAPKTPTSTPRATEELSTTETPTPQAQPSPPSSAPWRLPLVIWLCCASGLSLTGLLAGGVVLYLVLRRKRGDR